LHKPETEKPNQNQTKINIKTEPKKPSQIEKKPKPNPLEIIKKTTKNNIVFSF
jgi:hypothetical protein